MEAHIESLPGDLSGLLLSFLTGFDLLPLAHASPTLYRGRLSSNGDEWRSRQPEVPLDVRRFRWAWTHGGDKHSKRFGRSILPREEPKPWFKSLVKNVVTALRPSGKTKLIRNSYAHQYFTHESLLFYGQPRSANGSFQYGGIISVPVKPLLAWKRESFAIDLWFAPLSVPGVLLSMEFRHSAEDYLPHYHSIIHVDEQGRLYCSMIDNATVMCANVKPNQWYHLALSYQQDPTGERGVQSVYLNGELVVYEEGVSLLHHIDACQERLRSLGYDTTFELTACQIGAKGDSNPFPAASNFDGIIDDVRFWRDELTQEEVRLLVKGNDRQVREQAEYEWSLKQSVSVWFEGQVTCVQCSRPQEGRCVEIQPRLVVIRDNFASKLKRYRRRRPSRSNS